MIFFKLLSNLPGGNELRHEDNRDAGWSSKNDKKDNNFRLMHCYLWKCETSMIGYIGHSSLKSLYGLPGAVGEPKYQFMTASQYGHAFYIITLCLQNINYFDNIHSSKAVSNKWHREWEKRMGIVARKYLAFHLRPFIYDKSVEIGLKIQSSQISISIFFCKTGVFSFTRS